MHTQKYVLKQLSTNFHKLKKSLVLDTFFRVRKQKQTMSL